MAMIYDLDNEYGGRILRDDNTIASVQVGGTVNGTASVAPLRIQGQSAASAAALGFRSAISLTSVIFTSAAHFDYAIPVEINGEARYIPVLKAAGLSGTAAHS